MKNNAEMKSKNSLSSCCVYFGEDKNDAESLSEKFVGLKYADGKLKVYFPVGYRKPDESNNPPEKTMSHGLFALWDSFRIFFRRKNF